ncbi:Leo1-like protein-domain-containing protein [Crucibulum laeve]|uniref:Leo1-like protein-domain-containing protein n=1 Tax=Crucibulum laeve TaxID=68775 RepID=A0A5C3M504_9AGAR|nr:Leo1-like protein-domain-containing protein [Crucibulum laeve]
MSSLAGALDEYPSNSHHTQHSEDDDVDMDPSASPNDEASEEGDEEMADLFGNDNDVEVTKHDRTAASPTASGPDSRLPSPERERRHALEYEEDENPPEIAVEVKEAEVAFPNIPVPRSSDSENWVIRMPNFVKVDSKPFHPDTYIGPEHEDEEMQQAESLREKSMTIKLKVENTVRWRWRKDEESGHERRESNSRIIRWSDGTLSLRLGKELFDINQSIDNSAGVPRQYIGGPPSQSQSSQSQPPPSQGKYQGLTYLVAQHKRSQVLQSEAVITGYMSLRPTGMQSETHRMLVRAVGQKHNKVARLRMAPDPTMDPEREKLELMKKDAKKSKKKIDRDDGLGGGRKKRYSRRTAEHDVWSDDEEDAGGFAASDEEDEDGMGGGSPRKSKRKETEEKKGPEDYQEDDFVVADSSEEEGGSHRKRARDGSEVEEDPLDRLDAKIEQQDAKKRRKETSGKGGDEDETDDDKGAAMDVESEEEDEEEEFKVRRAGAGTRKRAVNFDDDEE